MPYVVTCCPSSTVSTIFIHLFRLILRKLDSLSANSGPYERNHLLLNFFLPFIVWRFSWHFCPVFGILTTVSYQLWCTIVGIPTIFFGFPRSGVVYDTFVKNPRTLLKQWLSFLHSNKQSKIKMGLHFKNDNLQLNKNKV